VHHLIDLFPRVPLEDPGVLEKLTDYVGDPMLVVNLEFNEVTLLGRSFPIPAIPAILTTATD